MKNITLITLLIGLLSTRSLIAQQGNVPDAVELQALTDLYTDTYGPAWLDNTNWLNGTTSADFDTWYGITVTNGDVTEIRLESNVLTGKLPESLGDLTELKVFYINSNSVGDTIPDSFGNLTKLEYLKMEWNDFEGPVPSSFKNLVNLKSLLLSGNDLTGSIDFIVYYTNLTNLSLAVNSFSGIIPFGIGNLTKLRFFTATYNDLTGEIPSSIADMIKLEKLSLHDNQLSGTVPDFTGNSSSFWYFNLNRNQLTGIPDFSAHPNASSIRIYVNNNQLKMSAIEQQFTASSTHPFHTFQYSSQTNAESVESDYFIENNTLTLSIDPEGTHTQYQWEKEIDATWTDISGATSNTHQISTASSADAGNYRCKLTNSWVSGLTLYSKEFKFKEDLSPQILNPPNSENSTTVTGPVAVVPVTDAGPHEINYVRSFTAREADTISANFNILSEPSKTQISTQYLDGLGRPKQSVVKKESPESLDIVQPVTYDQYGRVDKQYLPYSQGNSGSYVPNALLNQYNFYNGGAQDIAHTQFAYSENTFEPSPLNRVIAVNAPGKSWAKGSNHGVKTEYEINSVSDSVRVWELNGGLSTTDIYPSGQLRLMVTIDEHQNEIQAFKDKQDQVILKRVEADSEEWLETYYVYDDLNNLRYVIPPEGVDTLKNTSWAVTQNIINDWMFVYTYDSRQRMIEKKVPGSGTVYMIYDKRDRLRLTQDSVQRAKNHYTFTKYDKLNRPILTGIDSIADPIDTIRNLVGNLSDYETQSTNQIHGYTNTTYPTAPIANDYLTVTYYDNYEFDVDGDTLTLSDLGDSIHYDVIGQTTGSKVRVLDDTNLWIKTETFYDDRYRVIQMISDNHVGGSDRVANTYDFQGLILKSLSSHSTSSETHAVLRLFDYDHTGRLLKVYHQLDNKDTVLLQSNEYNTIGELTTKYIHSKDDGISFLQKVDYSYNIRGWLTEINDPELSGQGDLFGMELFYDYGFDYEQYNGNISGVRWKTLGDENTIAYGYRYDKVNRLLGADYVEGSTGAWNQKTDRYSVQNINYDKNGNILTLDRYGEVNGSSHGIDRLDYGYSGNQLTRVDDGMEDDLGFKESSTGGTEYVYDGNGNMTEDSNKEIASIEYNYLNLPSKVTKNDGQYIRYLYDAAGIKISQSVYNALDSLIKQTDYIGEYVYEDDSLQFIQHEEGRIVFNREYNFYEGEVDREAVYQYHLKDHLGNVRMTIQDKDTVEYLATMEKVWGATRVREDSLFMQIYWTADSIFPALNHTPIDSTITPDPEHTAYLNGVESIIGPSKMLHVLPGDEIQMETYVYYYDDGNNYTEVIPLEYIASLLSLSFTAAAPGEQAVEIAQGFDALSATNHPWNSTPDPFNGKPRAFLNYILFDKDHNFVDMGADELTSDGKYTNPASPGVAGYLTLNKSIDSEGYIYVFLSNETPFSDVYFDDLKITHIKSPIVQHDDYYPFGLTFGGYKRENEKENKLNTFQDQEIIKDLDLNWVQFKWRNHDPATGRFFNVDPIAEDYYYNSPYAFSENKVTSHFELEGLESISIHSNSFAPYDRFGSKYIGGKQRYGGDGSNRQFGTNPDASSRIRNSSYLNVTGNGITRNGKSEPRGSKSEDMKTGESTYSEARVETKLSGSTGDGVNSSADFSFHLSGNNDLVESSWDIDTKGNMKISAVQGENGSVITFSGKISGDGFPANETFIMGAGDIGVILGVSGAGDGDPATTLMFENNRTMSEFSISVNFNSSGVIQGVNYNGKDYSVEDWNKQFTSQDPQSNVRTSYK